jgi:hypothetical protein
MAALSLSKKEGRLLFEMKIEIMIVTSSIELSAVYLLPTALK